MTSAGTRHDQTISIRGALTMDDRGTFADRGALRIAGGRFAGFGDDPETDRGADRVVDASGYWIIPGVYDCHTHLTWNDFHLEDRRRHSADETARRTAASLAATLRGGVTSARDGGGADRVLQRALTAGALTGPHVQVSVDMIGRDQAGSVARVSDAVRAALDKGAQWIKLIATAGSSTPGDKVLESHFSRDEFLAAGRLADAGGARLMVHTWGGDSVDWAIEAGAGSIEHGIYLTPDQARRAAEAGLTFVPTLTIYRHVRDMVEAGELSGIPLARITDVIAVHERAVLHARDAGLPVALGSDFTTPWQHGINLVEIAALIRAGLTGAEALLAATRNGALLLDDGGSGRIATGERADAVVLSSDPTDPASYDGASAVVAVVKDGDLIFPAG